MENPAPSRRWHRVPTPVRKTLIAVLGVALMVTAVVLGPFPGPGGIPLFLGGIAVLATEFHWANRVWRWFRTLFDRYLAWPRWARLLFWAGVVAAAWLGVWGTLAWQGVPGWFPDAAARMVRHLPFVR